MSGRSQSHILSYEPRAQTLWLVQIEEPECCLPRSHAASYSELHYAAFYSKLWYYQNTDSLAGADGGAGVPPAGQPCSILFYM